MTTPPCRVHGPGGVTSSGGTDRPLIRGMTTGFFAGLPHNPIRATPASRRSRTRPPRARHGDNRPSACLIATRCHQPWDRDECLFPIGWLQPNALVAACTEHEKTAPTATNPLALAAPCTSPPVSAQVSGEQDRIGTTTRSSQAEGARPAPERASCDGGQRAAVTDRVALADLVWSLRHRR